ncbi:ABC transporter ATP-binding protein [Cronobacter turicensis]
MGKKDDDYQVVYRGEDLPRYVPGGLVFFQRLKECGGGYWLGRTCDGVFMFEYCGRYHLARAALI